MRWVALAVSACSAVTPLQRAAWHADGKPVAVAGESMTYRVSIRGIVVGRIDVAVGEPGVVEGHTAIVIRARASVDGFVATLAEATWEQTTTLDTERGVALTSVGEGTSKLPGERAEHTRETSRDDYDLLAATAAIRGVGPAGRVALDVALPGFERVHVDVREIGAAAVPGSQIRAVRLAGEVAHHAFSVWLSDDGARVPLRFAASTPYGELEMRLDDYHAPAG